MSAQRALQQEALVTAPLKCGRGNAMPPPPLLRLRRGQKLWERKQLTLRSTSRCLNRTLLVTPQNFKFWNVAEIH
jgi:hypothetical protein